MFWCWGGLTFGIFKKNRVCMVVMFVYYLIGKVIQFSIVTPRISRLILPVLLTYGYFDGIRGTFDYQSIMKARQGNS
jgi:hypothetical protein